MKTTIHQKIPPQDLAAEEAVLGAILLEKNAIEEVINILSEDDFYLTKNQYIYRAVVDLYKENQAIDMITICQQLKKTELLDACGGPFSITEIVSKITSTAHIQYHALMVKDLSLRRQSGTVGGILWESSFIESEELDELLFRASKGIDKILETMLGQSPGKLISDVMDRTMQDVYKRVEQALLGQRSGVDTGLTELNRVTNGWQPGELIVVASRPSMGKTAMMLHFAKRAAQTNIPVTLFSIEMGDISLGNRLLLSETNINPEKFKSGNLNQSEIKQLEQASQFLSSLPIYIDDNPCITMSEIRIRCKLLKKQNQCGIIFLDYLQLTGVEEKENRREREVANMSRMAKIIAKELNVPFILLSQLNRSNETRVDKKPLLSDLRESGAIEQDADMVCFVHRPAYYGIEVFRKDNNLPEINYGEFIIAKNRSGATPTIKFKHNDSMTKFYDYK